jgi:hypothetical protein
MLRFASPGYIAAGGFFVTFLRVQLDLIQIMRKREVTQGLLCLLAEKII